ncbi:MAG: AEC family transporter [Methanococcaceae archaeon]
MNIVFSEILGFIILVMIGIIGSRSGVITSDAKDLIAKVIFNITLPLMLLCNFSKLDITPRLIYNSVAVIVLALFTLLLMYLMGWLISRFVRMKKEEITIFKVHCVFGNLVYLGFPIIAALYKAEGLLYAGMFQLVSNMLLWTIGVVILNQGNNLTFLRKLKYIFNINTIAVLIGFLMFLLSLKLPPVLLNPLNGLGDSTVYLSMLYIGSTVFYSKLREFLYNKEVYVLTLYKLIIGPAIILAIFSLLNRLLPGRFDPVVVSTLMVMVSMPAMANVVIMARNFGADDKLAAANVFVSTLVSLITLPLILLLMDLVL